jgi:ribosomal protein L22
MADDNPDKKNSKEVEKKATKSPPKKAAKAVAKKATKKSAKKAASKTQAKAPAKKTAEKAPAKAKAESKAKAAPKKVAPELVVAPVVRASARYVRIAPRKARLIADQVRGLHIEKARALLRFSPRGAAEDIHKLIDSAAANAENNHDLIGDEMRISSITVDEGPTLKRYRPRAQGRATPIHKRTSHIAVALTPVED